MNGTVKVDDFIQMAQQLTAEHRIKEALDFVYAHSEPDNFRQFRVLCLYTAAGLWQEEAGDGETARQKLFEILQFIEEDMSMITEVPSLQEVMEDMYIKTCELICDMALSYEEYEQHMAKIALIRPYTTFQKGQMELIQNMKDEGQPWVVNMFLLAERYVGNGVDGQQQDRYANAAALYQLILQNRRLLRPSRADLKIAGGNYGAYMFNLVQKHLSYCHTTSTPCNPDNYLFMLDKARDVLEESKRDVGDPAMTDELMTELSRTKTKLLEMKAKAEAAGYNYTRPGEVRTGPSYGQGGGLGNMGSQVVGNTPPDDPGVKKMEKGMRVGWLVFAIILTALAAFLWYRGITLPDGKWWRILLAVICTFGAIGNYSFFGASRRR
ncbi:hypothetical protein LJC56_06105 [Christensenellaceae bacterium OttesenSCG-928-K19]|nr:hypothetical protein [Christensenellaceae bacterium OttesenSCG-928-K19]